MPSPLGHTLAGLAMAWVAAPGAEARSGWTPGVWGRVTAACAALAVAPDVDIFVSSHRTGSHSLTSIVLVAAVAAILARSARIPPGRTALVCGLAWGSHTLLDWLGQDRSVPQGVMALWPFSRAYFISGLGLFADVSRRYWLQDEFVAGNLRAVARELVILGPLAAAAFWWSRRRFRGGWR